MKNKCKAIHYWKWLHKCAKYEHDLDNECELADDDYDFEDSGHDFEDGVVDDDDI